MTRRQLVDLGAMTLLLGVGVLSFGPVFDGRVGYVAAGAGVLLGGAAATLGAWRRWGFFAVAALVVAAYFLAGGLVALPDTLLAGVLPSAETLHRLLFLGFQSWRDLLTVTPPADAFAGPAVVPFLSGLVASVLAVSAALRLRRWSLLALLPALALLVVGILWGVPQAPLAGLLGVVFSVVGLAWAAWRQGHRRDDESAEILERPSVAHPRLQQGALAGLLLGLAAVAGVGVAAAAPHDDRYVLREDVTPPLDLRDYATPLTLFRSFERDRKDAVLFTVDGLPEDARIRLAALDTYDGNVFRVGEGSAGFRRVGTAIAAAGAGEAPVTTLAVAVDDYAGVWLPGSGDLRGVRFEGAEAPLLADGLYYNRDTGNALTTAGLRPGSAYTLEVALPAEPGSAALEAAPVADVVLPEPRGVPDVVGKLAPELAGRAETPYDQLTALSEQLRSQGYFSDGSRSPSRPGHTTERISTFLSGTQLVGDDEQYAVAMALMARHLRLPARVVMGFVPDPDEPRPDGPLPVTGADARVWVEVDFGELGWVPFDPTPERDKTPDTKAPQPQEDPQPEVLPPPDPPREPPAPPLDSAEDDRDRDDDASAPWVVVVLWAAAGIGLLLLALLPLALVAWAKRRRRRRRLASARPADRVSGAWDEVVDHAVDAGFVRPAVATRRETAGMLAEQYPVAGSVAVADRVDRSVFGSADPAPDEVDAVWGEVDRLRGELGAGLGRGGRLRARYSTRSLRTRRAPGRPGRLGSLRGRLRSLPGRGWRPSGPPRAPGRENAADPRLGERPPDERRRGQR